MRIAIGSDHAGFELKEAGAAALCALILAQMSLPASRHCKQPSWRRWNKGVLERFRKTSSSCCTLGLRKRTQHCAANRRRENHNVSVELG
jgi:hypothetical protein